MLDLAKQFQQNYYQNQSRDPMSLGFSTGYRSLGFAPPGQFEDILNLIRQASEAARQAMNAAKYSQLAASQAAAAGQNAIANALHMVWIM